jgi:membrane protein YdbS with pleckstrin-like domain
MISLLVKAMRPLFVPLLKLRMEPPHLPEGSTLVRQLKPAPSWLTLRYLGVLAGMGGNLFAGIALSIGAVAKWEGEGLAVAAGIWVVILLILGFALVSTRLDFELRDYLVGDKSLRVRMGAVNQREVTLSYANVQNIEVRQGPLERLFGFKSLTVSTAGGGSSHPHEESSHEVTLAGLTNADEIRALVMSMLKQHKDTGLSGPAPKASAILPVEQLREVLEAARTLEAAARRVT